MGPNEHEIRVWEEERMEEGAVGRGGGGGGMAVDEDMYGDMGEEVVDDLYGPVASDDVSGAHGTEQEGVLEEAGGEEEEDLYGSRDEAEDEEEGEEEEAEEEQRGQLIPTAAGGFPAGGFERGGQVYKGGTAGLLKDKQKRRSSVAGSLAAAATIAAAAAGASAGAAATVGSAAAGAASSGTEGSLSRAHSQPAEAFHAAMLSPSNSIASAPCSSPPSSVSRFKPKAAKSRASRGQSSLGDCLGPGARASMSSGLRESMSTGFKDSASMGFNSSAGAGFKDSMSMGYGEGGSPGCYDSMSSGFKDSMSMGFTDSMSTGYSESMGFKDSMSAGYNEQAERWHGAAMSGESIYPGKGGSRSTRRSASGRNISSFAASPAAVGVGSAGASRIVSDSVGMRDAGSGAGIGGKRGGKKKVVQYEVEEDLFPVEPEDNGSDNSYAYDEYAGHGTSTSGDSGGPYVGFR
ncbi:unnamed protein product [Closterium sp. NIES-53]